MPLSVLLRREGEPPGEPGGLPRSPALRHPRPPGRAVSSKSGLKTEPPGVLAGRLSRRFQARARDNLTTRPPRRSSWSSSRWLDCRSRREYKGQSTPRQTRFESAQLYRSNQRKKETGRPGWGSGRKPRRERTRLFDTHRHVHAPSSRRTSAGKCGGNAHLYTIAVPTLQSG
jgi:hypothetical protein